MDVPTLYGLTVGTLCLAVAMTLWERKAHPGRAGPLGIWASAYAAFALGCMVMMNRSSLPGVLGMALTNVIMVTGYLLVLHGAIRLDGRGRPLLLTLPLVAISVVWTEFGARYGDAFWQFGGSLPILLVSFATAIVLARSRALKGLRSRPLAIAVHLVHGLFYLGRFAVMPFLAEAFGPEALALSAKITMFEAVLYSVAMPAAFLALVREEAQDRLLAASQTDYLTGLGNRHAFFERGAALMRDKNALTLLAFDLDHFKSINDRHGHAAGDEVLKLFADVARAGLGSNAILARLGGEEFAALLPGMGANEARPLAEALCRSFAMEAAKAEGLAIRATVSVGLAEREPERPDLQRLLSAADQALYRAKSLGRDRVEAAAPAIARAA
ncbi:MULTISPECIES: sensor domain-containing diguanylate cyclase [unclassified Aureimonas]|uniref:GGDEF domain-containing protein n=1 Tax=unclassified Aureimonas TaxID=2615206 RepID=UPI0019100430|nr:MULTISPECIES: GGDEF domain-containing protein [unclassified Aureimonas]